MTRRSGPASGGYTRDSGFPGAVGVRRARDESTGSGGDRGAVAAPVAVLHPGAASLDVLAAGVCRGLAADGPHEKRGLGRAPYGAAVASGIPVSGCSASRGLVACGACGAFCWGRARFTW